MSFTHLTALIIGLYLMTFNASASEKVYRWIDSKGVAHYSHLKPSDKSIKYEEIKVRSRDSYQSAKDVAKKAEEQGSPLSKFDEVARKNCDIAKQNVKVLTAFKNITQQDDKGETVKLSDEQRKEQLALANKQVDLFCKK